MITKRIISQLYLEGVGKGVKNDRTQIHQIPNATERGFMSGNQATLARSHDRAAFTPVTSGIMMIILVRLAVGG